MRILQIHNRYRHLGGEDGVVASEARLLTQHGHDVIQHFADNRTIGRLGGVRAAAAGAWNLHAYSTIKRLLRERSVDVVHVHNLFPLISPSVCHAARRTGTPVVCTVHNYRLSCPNGVMLRDEKPCSLCLGRRFKVPAIRYGCYRRSRAASAAVAFQAGLHHALGSYTQFVSMFIALTGFSRSTLIAEGFPENHICLKPNFVAEDPGPGTGQGGYILFVGRLSPEKGIRVMLEAWRRHPDLPELRIAGEGPEAPLVADATADRRIRHVGHRPRDEVAALMRAAAAVVFPSIWFEGMPLTLLEALACGTPVVASRLGGIPEIIRDDVCGVLFEAGDSDALATAVRQLCHDPARRARLAAEARADYVRFYSPASNYTRLLDIYRQVIHDAACHR